MKKLVFIMLSVIALVSCGNNEASKIQENLENVVIEHGAGFVNSCKTMSINIDTIRVADIKRFIEECFPKEEYPYGVPTEYEETDEAFSKFIAPLNKAKDDNEIVYLTVKHKYEIRFASDPFGRTNAIITANRLIDPITFEYIADNIMEDDSWESQLVIWKYNYNLFD